MIVVDSSALIAILLDEPEKESFITRIDATEAFISPVNYVEASMVAESRRDTGMAILDTLIAQLAITITATTADQARLARNAYLRFGKGTHAARLNLGDCFAYGLAMSLNAPLLFKGEDFAKTDIERAV